MAYLVHPFRDRDLHEAFAQLEDANSILKTSIVEFSKTVRIPDSRQWACDVKRLRVPISGADSRTLLTVHEYDYGEIINQCATLERLMDAMQWAVDHLPDHRHIVSCDPTQSRKGEADLIIKNSNSIAMFEISDKVGADAFRRKVRTQTNNLGEGQAKLRTHYPNHSVRAFIAMNADGPPIPTTRWLSGSTGIWEIPSRGEQEERPVY
jgi:hypothetical protein